MIGVFLGYANAKQNSNSKNHLDNLGKEYREVHKIFLPLQESNFINLQPEQDINAESDIDRFFTKKFCANLAIFSFSGHAGGSKLMFSDRSVRCEGLSEFLSPSRCPNLKLVFLNGCLTSRCMSYFEKAGIPIIISTGKEVDDKDAMHFAINFYQGFVNGNTVFDAYKNAITKLRINISIDGTIRNYTKSHNGNSILDEDISPWHFNYREEKFKTWTLKMGNNIASLLQVQIHFHDEIQKLRRWVYSLELNSISISHCTFISQDLTDLKAKLLESKSTSIFLSQTIHLLNTLLNDVQNFEALCTHDRNDNLVDRKRIVNIINNVINKLRSISE